METASNPGQARSNRMRQGSLGKHVRAEDTLNRELQEKSSPGFSPSPENSLNAGLRENRNPSFSLSLPSILLIILLYDIFYFGEGFLI